MIGKLLNREETDAALTIALLLLGVPSNQITRREPSGAAIDVIPSAGSERRAAA